MKKMIQSKSFYMMMMSLLTLLLSLIEYFVVIYATPYAFLPRFMGIIILISLYAYAFSLKKIQTKYNVLVLIYILQWIGSIFVCWIIELSGKLEIRNHFFLSSMNLMFSIIMIISQPLLQAVDFLLLYLHHPHQLRNELGIVKPFR